MKCENCKNCKPEIRHGGYVYTCTKHKKEILPLEKACAEISKK